MIAVQPRACVKTEEAAGRVARHLDGHERVDLVSGSMPRVRFGLYVDGDCSLGLHVGE